MNRLFTPGDFLIFQIESGFGLLRVLAVEDSAEPIWHLRAYSDLFMEVDQAVDAIERNAGLSVSIGHVALTQRAFESTQVSKVGHAPLSEDDLSGYREWPAGDEKEISDRSIRLLMGLR